jgi:tetrahydromethanopterin S-methyltransferase subunit G
VTKRQFSDISSRLQRVEKDTEFLLEEVNLLKARLSKVEHRIKRVLDHVGGVSGE